MSTARSTGDPLESVSMLIAFDGSPHAEAAVRAASALLPGRLALVVCVWGSVRQAAGATRLALPEEIIAQGVAAIDAESQEEAARVAAEGARLAQDAGLHAEAIEAVRRGGVAATIAAVADTHGAGVVVVGSRGRSAVRSTVLGSVTYGLLHASQRPLFVARADSGTGPVAEGPMLLCYDGSGPARHALNVAGRLLGGARGLVVHCWQPVDDSTLLRSAAHPILAPQLRDLAAKLRDADRERAELIAAEGAELARAAGFDATPRAAAQRDGTWETLAHVAEDDGARLVVAGSRGRSSLASLVIGSVSHGLLHHLRRPLLIVPPAEERANRS